MAACSALMYATSSCKFVNENFCSAETCTKWYLDKIYESALEGDQDAAEEYTEDLEEWLEGLDSKDTEEAGLAALEWLQENPVAAEAMEDFLYSEDYDDDYYW